METIRWCVGMGGVDGSGEPCRIRFRPPPGAVPDRQAVTGEHADESVRRALHDHGVVRLEELAEADQRCLAIVGDLDEEELEPLGSAKRERVASVGELPQDGVVVRLERDRPFVSDRIDRRVDDDGAVRGEATFVHVRVSGVVELGDDAIGDPGVRRDADGGVVELLAQPLPASVPDGVRGAASEEVRHGSNMTPRRPAAPIATVLRRTRRPSSRVDPTCGRDGATHAATAGV